MTRRRPHPAAGLRRGAALALLAASAAACAEPVPPPPAPSAVDRAPAPAPPPPARPPDPEPPPAALPAEPESLPVRLSRGGPRTAARVLLAAPWRVVDGAGVALESPPGEESREFVLENGACRAGDLRLAGPTLRFLPLAGQGLRIDGKPYPGELEASFAEEGRVVLVARVSMADYLAGVLAGEMPSGAGAEALRALAILARSFALAHLAEGLTDDPGVHQAFAGSPDPRAAALLRAAAASTEGLRLADGDGKPLPGYWYHSTCGGRTTTAASVFGVPATPAYAGVECPWCTSSKYFRWELEVPEEDVRRALRFGSPVADLSVGSRGPDGRTLALRATAAGGTVKEVPALQVRAGLGPNRLRSTLLDEAAPVPDPGGRPKTFRFRGRGWGHGVGLCQIGAFTLAAQGRTAEEILAFYFPGTKVVGTGR